tara:strand:- start:412 stop:1344 length:933 start_codon:yes stop_codon:yes gene_type:complete
MFKLNFKKTIKKSIKAIYSEQLDKKIILEAKQLGIKNNKFKKIDNLSNIEFQVFSQWGEDGIIDWMINKIKKMPKNFLEIGTQDYKESNTRYLLINNNWDGYLIEGNKDDVKLIKKDRIFWKYNLKIQNKYINTSNILKTMRDLNIPNKIGLISIDIDGIDYWILKKIKFLKPVIFICEFNPLFGYVDSLTVPNKKNFNRNNEHYSNLYFGASLKAFQNLLRDHYIFVGTNSAGNNAFFIKNSHSKFIKGKIKEFKVFKSKFRESRNRNKHLNYLDRFDSLKKIKNKKIIDLKKNTLNTINEKLIQKIRK